MDPTSSNPSRLAFGQAAGFASTGTAAAAPLTADQRKALEKLHRTAQQMESLFVNMLFKEMRKSAPQGSLTGKPSQAEQTFGDMLDEKRAEALATTGSLGIGRVLEDQLRASVLGTAPSVPGRGESGQASRE